MIYSFTNYFILFQVSSLNTSGSEKSSGVLGGSSGPGSGILGSGSGGGLSSTSVGYSLHQPQGDKQHGVTRAGYLLKKSEGKMRRVWLKRRCRIQAEGFLDICHADETKPPTRVNLLTCQIKLASEDKRCFDLISYNRTYHFQAEDENDQRAWMSVLVNCKECALLRAFDDRGGAGGGGGTSGSGGGNGLLELQQAIIRHVQRMPGNDRCCDCNSTNGSYAHNNFANFFLSQNNKAKK